MNNNPTNPNDHNNVNSADDKGQQKFEFKPEPVTPKKPVEEKHSFWSNLKHKAENKAHKEPTLGEAPAQPDHAAQQEIHLEPVSPVLNEHENEPALNENEPAQSAVVPPVAPKANWKKPETWGILSRLPAKHRRLVVALLILILLLLLVLWLKPSNNTTVEALQNQNSNALPIEFQPLNQSEEQQVNQPAEDNSNTLAGNNESAVAGAPNVAENVPAESAQAQPQANVEQPAPSDANAQSAPPAVVPPKVVNKPAQPAVRKPSSDPQPAAKTTPKPVAKAPEKAKSEPSVQRPVPKAAPAPVVNAKPANKPQTSGPVRTLEIPKGVTLMQVFRNNNLNISDVNAMTKANGANGALSRFKPGDKVSIQLNSQGRVSRLTLENGSTFIRNSDGSYSFKK